jgi:Uma2 family endonuclease
MTLARVGPGSMEAQPLRQYDVCVNVSDTFPRRHVSAHEFLEMGAAGIFPAEARLELIEGKIIETAAIGSSHATVVRELTALFNRAAADRAIVSPRCPLILSDESVPRPDVVLLKPKADRYFSSHPQAHDALLVVEVSETVIRADLDTKVPHYARAGVPEVWIIDIERKIIRVSRHPDPDGYRTRFTVTRTDTVSAVAFVEIANSPEEFLQ